MPLVRKRESSSSGLWKCWNRISDFPRTVGPGGILCWGPRIHGQEGQSKPYGRRIESEHDREMVQGSTELLNRHIADRGSSPGGQRWLSFRRRSSRCRVRSVRRCDSGRHRVCSGGRFPTRVRCRCGSGTLTPRMMRGVRAVRPGRAGRWRPGMRPSGMWRALGVPPGWGTPERGGMGADET